MLVYHKDKVKAVFNGHVHHYYRMRVADPTAKDVQNLKTYPDHQDGIYQVNTGASGQGERATIVKVQINERNISFYALDADEGAKKPFKIIDTWDISDTHE